MRLLGEIIIIGALIYVGWEKPFTEWIHGPPPVVTAVPAPPPPRPIVRAVATPSGAWMWDSSRKSPLDPPGQKKSFTGHITYKDENGETYWLDGAGRRHYEP